MNKGTINIIFYMLITILVSSCGSLGAKKLQEPNNKKQSEAKEGDPFVDEVNQRIMDNKIDNAVIVSGDNADELVLLKSKVKYLETVINKGPGDTKELFSNPYSLFNQQIVMDNGTVYYGSVVYQDDQVVTIETLIGKLNLDRQRVMRVLSHQASENETPIFEEIDFDDNIDLIDDGNLLYESPAEVVLSGNIATSFDDKGNTVLKGQVKNVGGKRADFVKLNMTLYRDWSEQLPPKTLTVFVDGTTFYFDSDSTKMSNSSVEPKATADFSLVIPESFGTLMSWKYNIDFEQY
ncbi:MAG: hypothetical protein CMP89_10210 [Gammaproteobacteria bacterium]|jgi:hypothetical protein|nr:hypothetical protein [Gammaproteobacteria bacterium]|tara:strand:+ start:3182 stop:4060 length:879 start_codon:yes stop_codon:yes gene_type:complete